LGGVRKRGTEFQKRPRGGTKKSTTGGVVVRKNVDALEGISKKKINRLFEKTGKSLQSTKI